MQEHITNIINAGDIVCFKKVYKINLLDIINRANNYSKYMLVLKIIKGVNGKAACQVLCANHEINWVSIDNLNKVY